MYDYTEGEVLRFYNSSSLRENETLKTLAIAGRVSQADKKGWKDFIKSLDTAVKPIDKPKADITSDQGLGDFFNQAFVLTNPQIMQQESDKAVRGNLTPFASLSQFSKVLPLTPVSPNGNE